MREAVIEMLKAPRRQATPARSTFSFWLVTETDQKHETLLFFKPLLLICLKQRPSDATNQTRRREQTSLSDLFCVFKLEP